MKRRIVTLLLTGLAAASAFAQTPGGVTYPPAAGKGQLPLGFIAGQEAQSEVPPSMPVATPGSRQEVSQATSVAARRITKRAVPEQVMPGLGVMPGDKQALRANTVRVGGDRTEIVYVSASYPNRISTPFAVPRALDKSNADIIQEGQSLYVTLNDPKRAVALYITGEKPNDPVVSVTLVPRNLPPQTVVLQLDASPPSGGSAARDDAPVDGVYAEQIRYVMRQAAFGKAPEGYAEGALPNAVVRIGELVAVPLARYSGPHSDLYRYRVESASDVPVELDEGAFYSDGVRAVAFFPTAVLRKGDSTFVFVLADKSATGN